MKGRERKQLKQDQFIAVVTKTVDFAKDNWKAFVLAAGVLVLLGVIFTAGRMIRSRQLRNQSVILGEIFEIKGELEEHPEKIQELEQIAGKGKYARVAYVELAAYWMDKEEFDKAQAALKNLETGKKDLVFYQGSDLAAQIHMQRKEYDEAIAIYDRIEKDDPESYPLDKILFQKAQALEAKGDSEAALALYTRLQTDYAQTYYGFDAGDKIQKLEKKK